MGWGLSSVLRIYSHDPRDYHPSVAGTHSFECMLTILALAVIVTIEVCCRMGDSPSSEIWSVPSQSQSL
jgi:hypothetical protein